MQTTEQKTTPLSESTIERLNSYAKSCERIASGYLFGVKMKASLMKINIEYHKNCGQAIRRIKEEGKRYRQKRKEQHMYEVVLRNGINISFAEAEKLVSY